MWKSSLDRKTEVQTMTDQQNDQHHDDPRYNTHRSSHIRSQRIEYATEDRARESDRKQSDIRKRIAQKSWCCVISRPQAATEIDKRILDLDIHYIDCNL